MRKIIILTLFFILVLAACQNDSGPDAVPVDTDTSTEVESADESSPRTEATPDPGLPATYTPAPMLHGGHLYVVGGYTGTRFIHIVEAGDTLAKLCARYGVSVEELARINNIRNWNHIEVGDALIVPVPIDS